MHFATILLGLCTYAFAAPSVEQRIIGGNQVTDGRFSHQASLQVKSGGMVFNHVCGASIISPNWALTAAQCRSTFDLSRYRLIAGSGTRNVQITGIDEFILHPGYHGGKGVNDIALLLFSIPLTWTESVGSVKLPTPGSTVSGEATIASWGSDQNLEWATVAIVADCHATSDNTQICTSNDNIAVCNEDVGGGLVQDNVVVGLMSKAEEPCVINGAPAVYTRVDSHHDFIIKYVYDLQ